jgi:hypothetical protein
MFEGGLVMAGRAARIGFSIKHIFTGKTFPPNPVSLALLPNAHERLMFSSSLP